MLTYQEQQYYIDGKPCLLMLGELHYFRLDPAQWQSRIDLLKEMGCNGVATYIPWVCHAFVQSDIDLDGHSNPRLNLRGFLSLCQKNGLYIVARPGPFIMAEVKNEGIPYWVRENHPALIPTTFDGAPCTTRTLDYLAPDFLSAVHTWYAAVIPLLAEFSPANGGTLLAVQLDNEIGMLSWVSNSPDLTPTVLSAFVTWLHENYTSGQLASAYPFVLQNNEQTYARLRAPVGSYEIVFHQHLSLYMRHRFTQYVQTLKGYCESFGLRDVLYMVNIHGTGGGRGFTYPVGISQLMETYAGQDDITSGSDVYFGDMKIYNFQDMYLCNAMTAASNPSGKPLACLEFNAADSNYADDFGNRDLASAIDFKTRLFVAQGNKLINYYLFSAGENYRFPTSVGDGNDRIAFTGENHGLAAFVKPDGSLSHAYPRMKRMLNQMKFVQEKLAASFIDYDPISYAFIPDYYMTESHYPHAARYAEKHNDLEMHRNIAWESTVRALLLMGVKPNVIDVQRKEIPSTTKVLVLSSCAYMTQALQQKLCHFVTAGGKLLLQGRVPRYDEWGESCTLLADLLEVSDFQTETFGHHDYVTMMGVGPCANVKELNNRMCETLQVKQAEPLLQVYGNARTCAFYKTLQKGKAVVLSCDFRCDFHFYQILLDLLELRPALQHNISTFGYGVFMTNTINPAGEQFFHLINMDDVDKDFVLTLNETAVLPGREIHLPANDALMLPVNVALPFGKILSSSAEISSFSNDHVSFRNTEKSSQIIISTSRILENSAYIQYTKTNHTYKITTDNRLQGEAIHLSFR